MARKYGLGSAGLDKFHRDMEKFVDDLDALSAASKKKSVAKAKTTPKTAPTRSVRMDIADLKDIQDFNAGGSIANSGWNELEKTMRLVVEDIDRNLRNLTRQWAKETAAEMRAVTPVDSGNLRDSIAILTPNTNSAINTSIDVVDKKGPIRARVGIDEQRILPPPTYRDSTKRMTKGTALLPSRPVKVRIPPYNYAPLANDKILAYHTEGYPGYNFLEKWQEIALNNMMRIFA